MFNDYVQFGGVVHLYHIEIFVWMFKGLYNVVNAWILMFTSTSLGVYLAFLIWATKRKPGAEVTPFDRIFFAIYVIYQVGLFVFNYPFIQVDPAFDILFHMFLVYEH